MMLMNENFPDDAAVYMVLDIDSGNSLAEFEDLHSATSYMFAMSAVPGRRESIGLAAVDKTGAPLEFGLLEDFPGYQEPSPL
jgi:hypothetical protein